MADQWAAARGDRSKNAADLNFAEVQRQEEKDRKEREANLMFAAQEQRFRLTREAFEREIEDQEHDKREKEGQRVRERVITKKQEAEAARKRDIAEATLELKLHTEEDQREAAHLKTSKHKEAERQRKMTDETVAEAARLKKVAKDKQRQQERERNLKGHETSIAVKSMKDKQEEEEALAKRMEWIERQRRHEAEIAAEQRKQVEIHNEFNSRPHGAHLNSSLGEAW